MSGWSLGGHWSRTFDSEYGAWTGVYVVCQPETGVFGFG